MENLLNLETYFNTQDVYNEIGHFYIDFFLAGFCAFIVARIYQKYGKSISNRKIFSANFITLALTTLLIISIVKSSLALSLGLVGALSIVRFRSAIKEPEELTFLFLTMAIGLGFGSGQRLVTLLAFAGISIFLIARGVSQRNTNPEYNMLLSLASTDKEVIDPNYITDTIKKHASFISLKRFDQSDSGGELLMYVKFNSVNDLNAAADSIKSLGKDYKLSFIEDRGLFT